MNCSKIEWTDYSINPVKGLCPMACSYCYARRMYKRFKWNPEIRFEPEAMLDLAVLPENSKVFIGSTFELFHDSIPHEWLEKIFYFVKKCSWVTCIFLTKCPQNLNEWSPFPENCWVGVSATNPEQIRLAFKHLHYDVKASVKFISFEPLLGMIFSSDNVIEKFIKASGVNWVIIGAQTPYSPKTAPKMSWVQEILVAASNAGNIPVFMKNNLQPVIDHDSLWADWKLRQEFPCVIEKEGLERLK